MMHTQACCPRGARGAQAVGRGLCASCYFAARKARRRHTLASALDVVEAKAADAPDGCMRLAAWAIKREVAGV